MNYFYDEQIRKYILQFIRLFGGFAVKMGQNEVGEDIFQRVPARYGDIDRQVAHIIKENSENTIPTIPFLSCYVTDFSMNADRRRNPVFEDTVSVYEKKYDKETQAYTSELGNRYSIDRSMPVPYDMAMQVDLWTSSTEQKLQLMEQILVLYNPSLNIYTSDNPFDWSSLSYVELSDVTWSNRTVPVGTEDEIDIASLVFTMPIHISPPANLRRQTLIHTIITQLLEADGPSEIVEFETTGTIADSPKQWIIVTHNDYQLRFVGTTATLYTEHGTTSTDLKWSDLFKAYGGDEINIGISQLRLRKSTDPGDATGDVIGTIQYGSNDNELTVTLDNDTLPANTETAIIGIINPSLSYPGDGTLSAAASGQRYLITDTVPIGGAWGTIGTGTLGEDWVKQNTPVATHTMGVSYGNNIFVAVGFSGKIQSSPNGTDWTERTSGTPEHGTATAITTNPAIPYEHQFKVNAISVSAAGTGYTSAPTVTISAPDGVTAQATTSISGGALSNIVPSGSTPETGRGSGYVSTPIVTFTNAPGDTTGDGASATAMVGASTSSTAGNVFGYALTGAGSGYTLPPIATVASPNVQSTATVTVSDGGLDTFTITEAGEGYVTVPTVTITGGGATSENLYGVGYGNDQWVIVGTNATILTSTDAITWTIQTPPNAFTNQLRSVIYANNQYVVVGSGGAIITSPDAITWTEQTSGITLTIFDVIYANNLYVYTAWNGKIFTSPDAITWTERTSGTTENLRGIAYGNSTFVVTGVDDTILTSTDAITWTPRTSGVTDGFHKVEFGNGIFVAGGTNGVIVTSSDNGVTWTLQTTPTEKHVYDIAFGALTFVAVCHNSHILFSNDFGHGNKNDIIEYNGSSWVVSLDTSVTSDIKYVVNTTTSVQLEWTGSEWINSYEGTFNAGFWRIFL